MNSLVYVKSQSYLGVNFRGSHSETLSLRNIVQRGFATRAPSSPIRLGKLMATRKVIDRLSTKQVAKGSKGGLVNIETTKLRSH